MSGWAKVNWSKVEMGMKPITKDASSAQFGHRHTCVCILQITMEYQLPVRLLMTHINPASQCDCSVFT